MARSVRQIVISLQDIKKLNFRLWKLAVSTGEIGRDDANRMYGDLDRAIKILKDMESRKGMQTSMFDGAYKELPDHRSKADTRVSKTQGVKGTASDPE